MADQQRMMKIRIVSGKPEAVEAVVNQLVENYAPQVFNVQPGPEGPLVTVILVHQDEIRKAALANARANMPVVPPGMFPR